MKRFFNTFRGKCIMFCILGMFILGLLFPSQNGVIAMYIVPKITTEQFTTETGKIVMQIIDRLVGVKDELKSQ